METRNISLIRHLTVRIRVPIRPEEKQQNKDLVARAD
jgi:hypothetical protein